MDRKENMLRSQCPLEKERNSKISATVWPIKTAAMPYSMNTSAIPPAIAASPVTLELDKNIETNVGRNRSETEQVRATPQRNRFFLASSTKYLRFCFFLSHRLDSRCRRCPYQELGPAILLHWILGALCHLDCHLGRGVDDPIEVLLAYGRDFRIGSGVQEVDGIGHAALDRELHRVQVVAQSPTKRDCVFFHSLFKRGRGRWGISFFGALVVGRTGIVFHDVCFFLADDVAAVVLVELHAVLQSHAKVAGLVVVVKKFIRRMHFVDVLPSTA